MNEPPELLSIDHISDRDKIGIGSVALAWSFLEGAVERIIWNTIPIDRRAGIALTTHVTMPVRLHMMNSLLSEYFPDEPFTKEASRQSDAIINRISPRRNEIVHSRILQFDHPEAQPIRQVYKARGKITHSIKPIERGEYQEVCEMILNSASILRNIMLQIRQRRDPYHE